MQYIKNYEYKSKKVIFEKWHKWTKIGNYYVCLEPF